jgi:hypothetical protein
LVVDEEEDLIEETEDFSYKEVSELSEATDDI